MYEELPQSAPSLAFRPPRSVIEALQSSMQEEASAANWYRRRAAYAREHGDYESASLWEHIASEEAGHYREFKQRMMALPEYRAYEHRMEYLLGHIHPSQYHPEQFEEHHVRWQDRLEQQLEEEAGKRPFPQTYMDWVKLAEDIKQRYPNDPVMLATVNFNLGILAKEDQQIPAVEPGDVDDAKRWLTKRAGELGIQ